MGRDVHVTTTAHSITSFIDGDRPDEVCFRCGQTGHRRYQCLTYKVRLCWHFQRGACYDKSCTFAHGEEELRTPWKARCVRVVKHSDRIVCLGCNSTEHTFRKCPYNQNMMLL